ncbi:tetratricopeptide repeat protein [Draconibacterium orientale]|uniref:tetratricopeptide repeat protein n=1 Tax=Draconibacterium orientale TaxID=1168034 RepID=UPI0037486713
MSSSSNLTLKKQHCVLSLAALFLLFFACKNKTDVGAEVQKINAIYTCAEKQIGVSIDSAIAILDSGLVEARALKHDSLIVAGLFLKANCYANQGWSEAADSVYSLLTSNPKFNTDSVQLYRVKLQYAHFCQLTGNSQKAFDLCTDALRFFRQKGNDKATVLGYIYLSDVYTQQNEFTKAMEALTDALAIAEKIDDAKSLALLYGSLGKMYFGQQDYEKCLDCFNKMLEYNTRLNDIENLAVTNQNIGTILLIQEKYDEAENYLLAADSVLSKAGLNSKQVHVLNSLGALYERQKKYNKAIKTYNEVLDLNKQLNSPNVQSNVYINIGNVYYDRRNFDKAEEYYTKSFNSLQEAGETDFRYYYENMMFLNDEKGNWKAAYSWARKFHSHSDSIFNIEKYKETENLRNAYEAEKKDLQLANLKVEQEKNRARLLKNRVLLLGTSALFLLTLIFSLIYYRQNRLKLQSYRELVKKNEELVEANTERRRRLLLGDKAKPLIEKENGGEKSVLPEDLVQGIKDNLNDLIDRKFYVNPATTLNETARELVTNTSYLSQIINDSFGCNFPTFINQLRIEEAQRLLQSPEFDHLSIEGIGNQSGFKSKSAFNTAFKKVTGVTPSFYKSNSKS